MEISVRSYNTRKWIPDIKEDVVKKFAENKKMRKKIISSFCLKFNGAINSTVVLKITLLEVFCLLA